MNEIVIGLIILIVLVVVFLAGRKRQLARTESDRTTKQAERESWSKEAVVSYGQVQQVRAELIATLRARLGDQPEQLEGLREIIDEWADLKIQAFQERRSWVRRPDQTKPE